MTSSHSLDFCISLSHPLTAPCLILHAQYPYSLMTGVPPKPLDEGTEQSLEAAGLLNSVLIQRK